MRFGACHSVAGSAGDGLKRLHGRCACNRSAASSTALTAFADVKIRPWYSFGDARTASTERCCRPPDAAALGDWVAGVVAVASLVGTDGELDADDAVGARSAGPAEQDEEEEEAVLQID